MPLAIQNNFGGGHAEMTYKKKHYLLNSKKYKERSKKWAENNSKKYKENQKKYRLEHLEDIKNYNKEYIAKNSDKLKEAKKIYYKKNISKLLLKSKAFRKDYPEKSKVFIKNSTLKQKYGISLKEYNELLEKQGNKCAICKLDNTTSKKMLSVDHCHKTGKVRGLLCQCCNTGLGMLKDSEQFLLEALLYLKKCQ